ncbi:MAG TPA: hypothetical protein VFT98_00925 [Myxococcota bacterium]|nr:hypothetical protein [Myxococcota bacterium]
MTGIRFAALALVVSLSAGGLGCAAISLKDPMHHEDLFEESMKTFTQYVRWGNFNGAALYVVDEQQDELLELAPQLSDVRFTDYEILRKDLNDDRNEAKVDVVFTGYRLSSPISRTMRLHQEWKRTGMSEWRVTIELGPMREALGLAAK